MKQGFMGSLFPTPLAGHSNRYGRGILLDGRPGYGREVFELSVGH